MRQDPAEGGYSLIELLVVMAILLLIAASTSTRRW